MAELKTKPNNQSVEEFLDQITDPKRRRDCYTILKLMKQATKAEPQMWGSNIVGFGSYHYRHESGREADWFLAGFSPRAQNLALYLMSGLERADQILKKLGRYKTGKCCLYIKTLEDIDLAALKELVRHSVEHLSNAGRKN